MQPLDIEISSSFSKKNKQLIIIKIKSPTNITHFNLKLRINNILLQKYKNIEQFSFEFFLYLKIKAIVGGAKKKRS